MNVELLLLLALVSAALSVPTNSTSWDNTSWDVIVVGAGPAGIIVADRMSEAGKKTLLVEGGGGSYYITGGRDRPAWLENTELSQVDVPGLYKSIFADQGNLTCKDHAGPFGGCTIGGSSAINAGLFFLPPASDFDNGFPEGWKYKDVASAVDRVNERVPSSDVYSEDKKFYLQSGYEAAREWLVDSAGYSDVPLNKEANDKTKVFGRPVFDYDDGQRGGPALTYLQTSLKRNNFHLQTKTRVKKISRDGDTATGVVVNVGGAEKKIKLSDGGRIILSAGAIQSPQVLMFSGIGDPAIRQRLIDRKIVDKNDAWIDLKSVGHGLYDNPNTFIELESPNINSYVYSYSDPPESDAQLYIKKRSGPYSFASETSAFWDTITHPDGSKLVVQGTIDSAGFGEYMGSQTMTLNVYGTSGLHSRGKVILNDDLLPEQSHETYYSDPRDANGIATFIRDIFDHLNETLIRPLNFPINSTKDEIRDYITSETPYTRGVVNHWSSSCRIGPCVDVNAQVLKTKNIHVVDGSITEPFSVNPQFGIMIAAEHASSLILKLK